MHKQNITMTQCTIYTQFTRNYNYTKQFISSYENPSENIDYDPNMQTRYDQNMQTYSSNVNEVIKTILSQRIFFYKKILHAQKHSQAKIN